MKQTHIIVGLIILLLIAVVVMAFRHEGGVRGFLGLEPLYDPQINATEFRAVVQNRFFTIMEGEKLIYSGAGDRELTLPGDTKRILDVETVILYETVRRGGTVVKEAEHYIAQDADNNIWCFGQKIVNNPDDMPDTAGSWEAGVDKAKPGIWMKNFPQVGESFPQEYYKNGAEDIAEILSTSDTVETPFGTYFGCIKMRDWSPLAPGIETTKYYCPDIAKVVREEGNGGTSSLIEVTTIEDVEEAAEEETVTATSSDDVEAEEDSA
jgi:hypothetical protein